jgi:hypothetical protein
VRGTPRWQAAIEEAVPSCRKGDVETAAVATSPPGYGLYVSCQSLSDATR